MKRVLLIKLRYIGDVILSTPLLPLLTKHFPEVRLTFLVNEGTDSALRNNPYLEEIVLVPRGGMWSQFQFLHRLRKDPFDTVIDLTDGDRSALISYLTGAGVRLGFNRDNRWRGKLYTQVLPSAYGTMHMVDYHAQALAALGIPDAPRDPEVFLGVPEEKEACQMLEGLGLADTPLALLYPSARYVFKAWPLERFAALADWLGELGIQTILIGNQKEQMIGQQIINLSKRKPINLLGKTRLLTLAAIMKRCRLFVGNDGGPMHLAAAVGCPVLGLFGPSNPAVWGPRGKNVSVMYKGLDCRACFYPGCSRGEESCMRLIHVDEVCQAAQALLQASLV